ncbi:anti-sigma factor family protein [Singulisphaera rosea]
MRCRDFERIWNEQLDAREEASASIENELEIHAASCEPCRVIAARYQRLRMALRSTGPAPKVSQDLASRILTPPMTEPSIAFPRHRIPAGVVTFATAASLLLAFLLIRQARESKPGKAIANRDLTIRSIDPDSVGEALTIAKLETIALARETSAPAARIGLRVLESATIREMSSPAASLPSTTSSDVLQSVGNRVNAGVTPLSDTARHAFGFLFDTPAAGAKTVPPT